MNQKAGEFIHGDLELGAGGIRRFAVAGEGDFAVLIAYLPRVLLTTRRVAHSIGKKRLDDIDFSTTRGVAHSRMRRAWSLDSFSTPRRVAH